MSDQKIIFSMSRVSKTFPGKKTVIKDISLSFYYGAKIGLLGLNGAGKSTLMRIIAGIDQDHTGEVHLSKGISVGYLAQEPHVDPEKTVLEIVEEGLKEQVEIRNAYEDINAAFADPQLDDQKMNELLDQQAKLQDQMDALNIWELDSKLEQAMQALRCPDANQLCENLSGGEKRRVALCRLLLQEPDVLLLDEPTNHLDAETVYWLERHLQAYKGTVIAVTHDRYFLDNVAGWILELDRGVGIPWQGNYSSWLEQKNKRLEQESKSQSKIKKLLERELEFIRGGQKARQAKGKSRINNYEKMLEKSHVEKRAETNELFIPSGPRLGQNVLKVDHVKKAFGDKLLYEDLTFTLPPGAILAVIGPNGAGKSTLFKMITGEEKPDSGDFVLGDSVTLSYVDQSREMDPNQSIVDVISEGHEFLDFDGVQVNARSYISKFNFSGEDQKKKISELSGGEKNRVHLARTLKKGANVLLLDEPTNDLDVNTLRALETALEDYAGSAVIISHDRYFLDRVATHVLAFEGNSEVVWYEGSISDYFEDRRKRLGVDADIPKKISYKKLTR